MTGMTSASVVRIVCVAGVAVALLGCQGLREATGVAKLPPDEFTVLTKAPLVIPPDYNLRPPMPGAAQRDAIDPETQAQEALFAPNPEAAAQKLGDSYSPEEKELLAKTGGSIAKPSIRQAISADSGLADKGDGYANSVLFPDKNAPAPATAAPSDSGTPQVRGTTD